LGFIYHVVLKIYGRGEDPIGDWTLIVKDQNSPGTNGSLLGWNMILWGTSIDPSKATKWEVPVVDDVLPPAEIPSRPIIGGTPSPTTTKQHPKPTANLPGDHGIAPGENSKPAFTSAANDVVQPSATTTEPATITGSPDLGWFSDMSSLVTGQKWFFVALGAVSLFGISVGIFFWRRRVANASKYTPLGNDNEVSMTALGTAMSGPRTTRELYDAFGEVSDDDDDDETTALRQPAARSLGFHSGFLDDDEPSTAAGLTPKYRDEPDDTQHHDSHTNAKASEGSSTIPGVSSPTESGDGSWEHASRE
jgi:kexin